MRLPGGWSAARPGGGAGWSGLAAAGVVAGESSRARLRRGRGGRAVGPHGSVAGPLQLLFLSLWLASWKYLTAILALEHFHIC